jgi:hypothetical protein
MNFLLNITIIMSCLIATNACFARIPTGHVGIYSYFDQLQDNLITEPTFYNCLLYSVHVVQHIPDSDHKKNIHVLSSEGIEMILTDVEISNSIDPKSLLNTTRTYKVHEYDKKMVVDPMAQYLRKLAAERTVDQFQIFDLDEITTLVKNHIQKLNDDEKTGITIKYVRIQEIKVPSIITEKRKKLLEEKQDKKIAEQAFEKIKVIKETEMYVAQQDQAIRIENAKKANEIMLLNMEAERQKKRIENEILIETAQANAQKIRLEAEALLSMYTIPGYTDVKKMEAMSSNTKIYWGNELPSVMYSPGVHHSETSAA